MAMDLEQLRERLHAELRRYSRLVIAYSGGVDSSYLAWEAQQALSDGALAVIADSPSLPRTHLADAIAFAERHGIALQVVKTAEMERAEYVRNDGERCFHCKDELFVTLGAVVARHAGAVVAYGRNRDDAGDYRPGQRAAAVHGVAAPLADAGLGKAEIRALALAAGLEVWDRPASACLSSRLAYGQPVTHQSLRQVEEAEAALHAMGFKQVRVRHHGTLARIEIERGEMEQALRMDVLGRMAEAVRAAGFAYVTLDADGYRSGSMNAVLPVESLLSARHAS